MTYISREISVGNIKIGGLHRVRLQSMTNTNTLNTRATVEQSIRMIEAGAGMVRITARNVKEAGKLSEIKENLDKVLQDIENDEGNKEKDEEENKNDDVSKNKNKNLHEEFKSDETKQEENSKNDKDDEDDDDDDELFKELEKDLNNDDE